MASALSAKELTEQVVGYKKDLAAAVTGKRSEEITRILSSLKSIPATEELIRETKIGLSVGKLRQNENKAVADLAKEIVKKWKNDVGAKQTEKGATPAASPPAAASPAAAQSPAPSPAPTTASASTSRPAPPQPARKASVSALTPKDAANGAAGKPRTYKSDAVTADTTGDKTRDKCTELIYDALAMDSEAPAELLLERAQTIEKTVRKLFDGQETLYRNKMRSLFLNLKDKGNPGLRASAVDGEVSADQLAKMTPKEMASEERRAQDRKLAEENLLKAQGARPQAAETDMFKCGRCKQRKCTYYQMQTRSADEPMTTFVTCVNCGNRWKFS